MRDGRGNVVFQRSGAASDPWTHTHYDALSRLTKVESPFGDLSSTATTSFYFDSYGNRTKVLDPLDKATTFSYDAESRLAAVRDALAGYTNYGYDRQGNLTRVTDARTNATTYTYDDLGRLTKESPPGGASYEWKYEYPNSLGAQLTTATKPGNVKIAYVYDLLGQLTCWYNTATYTESGTFKDFGDRIRIRPSGAHFKRDI